MYSTIYARNSGSCGVELTSRTALPNVRFKAPRAVSKGFPVVYTATHQNALEFFRDFFMPSWLAWKWRRRDCIVSFPVITTARWTRTHNPVIAALFRRHREKPTDMNPKLKTRQDPWLPSLRNKYVLRPVSTSANSPRDQAMGYQGMRSSKSKLKASVYWRTRGQFWKLNQVQLFRDQNERKPIRFLLFNARACDHTGSRVQIRWSGNRPYQGG